MGHSSDRRSERAGAWGALERKRELWRRPSATAAGRTITSSPCVHSSFRLSSLRGYSSALPYFAEIPMTNTAIQPSATGSHAPDSLHQRRGYDQVQLQDHFLSSSQEQERSQQERPQLQSQGPSDSVPHHPGSWHSYGGNSVASKIPLTSIGLKQTPTPLTIPSQRTNTPTQSYSKSHPQSATGASPSTPSVSTPQSQSQESRTQPKPRASGSHYGPDPSLPKPKLLACYRCKNKKGKCDDGMPVCGPCVKASAECVRPSERKRKRTRKEMTEAELAEKEKKARLMLVESAGDNSQARAELVRTSSFWSLPQVHRANRRMLYIGSPLTDSCALHAPDTCQFSFWNDS